MELPDNTTPKARLERAKASSDCVVYDKYELNEYKSPYQVCIYGLWRTGEIFVEMSDGNQIRVNSFFSRLKCDPPEIRRQELPLVDIADAFVMARRMAQHWPRLRNRTRGRESLSIESGRKLPPRISNPD